jgi:hypothetical protein
MGLRPNSNKNILSISALIVVLFQSLNATSQIDTVFKYSDNGDSYYQISSNGWLLYSETREKHKLKEVMSMNKTRDTIYYWSYSLGVLEEFETFKYDSIAIGIPFSGDVWDIPGWLVSAKLYKNHRLVYESTYNYYYRGRCYSRYFLRYHYENNELVSIERGFVTENDADPSKPRKMKIIKIRGKKYRSWHRIVNICPIPNDLFS